MPKDQRVVLFCFLPFASQFLSRIDSHCDSVRDKSRCVLALPATASIATGGFHCVKHGQSHLTKEQTAKALKTDKTAELLM